MMIIDFHCHVGRDFSGKVGEVLSFDGLKKSMDKNNIDKAVVFCFNGSDERLIDDSIEILNESRKKNWIIPFLRFNPNSMTESELIRLLDLGFKGVKLHSSAQKFKINDKKFYWIYKIISDRGIPVLFHCSAINRRYSHPNFIIDLARDFPYLVIVMAHFFGSKFSLIKSVLRFPNIYVDSSINSGSLRRFQAVRKFGFKNLLFASDVPYDSQSVALLKIKEAGLDKEEEDLIFYKNALKVLD